MKIVLMILFIIIILIVIAFLWCAIKISSMIDNKEGDDKNGKGME